jgi:hypothetical protein
MALLLIRKDLSTNDYFIMSLYLNQVCPGFISSPGSRSYHLLPLGGVTGVCPLSLAFYILMFYSALNSLSQFLLNMIGMVPFQKYNWPS